VLFQTLNTIKNKNFSILFWQIIVKIFFFQFFFLNCLTYFHVRVKTPNEISTHRSFSNNDKTESEKHFSIFKPFRKKLIQQIWRSTFIILKSWLWELCSKKTGALKYEWDNMVLLKPTKQRNQMKWGYVIQIFLLWSTQLFHLKNVQKIYVMPYLTN
jgi:hypothetical protein